MAESEPAAVEDADVAPSVEPTVDIIGEPGVPYMAARAPMPSDDAPVHTAPKRSSAKARRGLRRLTRAIKRSA